MFKKAAVRLTLQYTLILIIIVSIFSASIYTYMDKAFGGDYVESHAASQVVDAREVADAGLDKLKNGLLIFNGGLLIIIPFLSYVMARRTLRPLRESYEKQEAFTDNASHEFRTPLTVIQGELELAVQKARPAEEYVDAIRSSLGETRKLISLTNQLLLLSRGGTPGVHKNFKIHPLGKIVTAAIDGLNLSSEEKDRIIVNVSQKISIYGNPGLLAQAIGNILSNAVKFTLGADRISLSGQTSGKMVKLIVEDTGKGMSRQELAHAFDRFWRAEHSRTTPGYGLGLPIVKQIIEFHDGDIDISSGGSSGTTVIIYLPAQ